ncbi:hypothetical protein GCM10009757_14250 [Streptomyces cheonanensis]|uniref:Secreted protein n=1 Tax=Streptomyces cheonanensis TaxID=312720 RepID=A0ABN2V0H4_9ACTN
MMRGSALATTVPARMATNMPAIRPDIAWSIWRLVMAPGVSSGASVATVTMSFSVYGVKWSGRILRIRRGWWPGRW